METRYRGGTARNQPVLSIDPYASESFNGGRRKRRINDNEAIFASRYSPIILLVLLGVVFCFVKYADNRLPPMIKEADSKDLPPDR